MFDVRHCILDLPIDWEQKCDRGRTGEGGSRNDIGSIVMDDCVVYLGYKRSLISVDALDGGN